MLVATVLWLNVANQDVTEQGLSLTFCQLK